MVCDRIRTPVPEFLCLRLRLFVQKRMCAHAPVCVSECSECNNQCGCQKHQYAESSTRDRVELGCCTKKFPCSSSTLKHFLPPPSNRHPGSLPYSIQLNTNKFSSSFQAFLRGCSPLNSIEAQNAGARILLLLCI